VSVVIEAPAADDPPAGQPSLFLAGGISGCPDWQADVLALLDGCDLTVFNPRRVVFDLRDAAAARQQIAWEHARLRQADAIVFWFPSESLCPIVLYELGAWSMTQKRLYVGAHPGYARRLDVVEQTRLARPDVPVVGDLDALAAAVRRAPPGS
jgi:hypothetical protein